MTGLSDRQLALRRTRITGHSAPALLGFSPYADPVRAWEEHTGRREVAQNEAMTAGTELEDALAAWAWKDLGESGGVKPTIGWLRENAPRSYRMIGERHLGDWPDEEGATLLHHQLPEEFAATPDQLCLKERIGMQVKNHGPMMAKRYLGKPGSAGKWDNNLVPLEILMQCQWELHITQSIWPAIPVEGSNGKQWVWLLVVLLGGLDRRIYWIRKDNALIEGMCKAGYVYWPKHLDPAGPQEAPTEIPWKAKPAKEQRKAKVSRTELAAAPIPFTASGEDPLDVKIPFLEGP